MLLLVVQNLQLEHLVLEMPNPFVNMQGQHQHAHSYRLFSSSNSQLLFKLCRISMLIFKAPRKTASENVVCLCRLLNILADFSNTFLHTGKRCGP